MKQKYDPKIGRHNTFLQVDRSAKSCLTYWKINTPKQCEFRKDIEKMSSKGYGEKFVYI